MTKRKYKQKKINFPIKRFRRVHTVPGLLSSVGNVANVLSNATIGVDLGTGGVTPIHRHHERTWGEFGTETAGTLSGAALGFIAGNVPGAMIGAAYGKRAAELRTTEGVVNMFDQKNETFIQELMSNSGYSGNVSKMTRASVDQMRKKYQANGAVVIKETFGKVTDLNLVGVGHTSFAISEVCEAVALAIVRKLLRKSGIFVDNVDQVLTLDGMSTSANRWYIGWETYDSNGTLAQSYYNFPANVTLAIICQAGPIGSGLSNVIYDMITDENPKQIGRILLGVNPGPASVNHAVINMKHEIVEIECAVHTVIQNRTYAQVDGVAPGNYAGAQTDLVGVQPLKGPVFQFKGIPQTKQFGVVSVNSAYIDGIYLFANSLLAANDVNAWKEPPINKAFNNCELNGYTRLNPGQLKDFAISDTYRGYFANIISGKFKVLTEDGVMQKCPGRSQIVWLEEELNSGSENKITVAYETQHVIGCNLISSKNPNMQPEYREKANLNLLG
ncbi:MAG: hypothetical protein ACKOW9_01295 [Candidatus Paceibacterota bacterium]